MKMMLRGFAAGLAIVLVALAPACRSTKKKSVVSPTTTTQQALSSTVPDVPAVVTTNETKVDTQPPDFVQDTPKPTVEALPTDIEQLNTTAQQRGYIRDAFFGYDDATLNADAQTALTATANWLKQYPMYGVLIEGHCDERGTEQYNLALGDRRAAIARDYLVTLGVDPGRVKTVSYGEERPFDPAHNESAWARNRRDHIVLTGTAR
ncbi:MAG TPA: peptidoglycan-associated lipoprotein Pal [Thermoanaerobaculia bacterium]